MKKSNLLYGLVASTPLLRAADRSCQPVIDTVEKQANTPVHTCISEEEAYRPGQAPAKFGDDAYERRSVHRSPAKVAKEPNHIYRAKEAIDMDVGGRMGKSHRTLRFEYGDVRVPAGGP